MTKKILNTTLPDKTDKSENMKEKLGSLSDRLIFEPTDNQLKIKSKFWTRFQPGPFVNAENITMAKAMEICKSANIKKWWHQEGFKDWFLNKEEEKERLKYLFNKGLDTIEAILSNPEANANAKANLIKMLAEMNGYLGKKTVEKFADDDINKMSENQLQTFLEQRGFSITEEKVINVTDSPNTGDKTDDRTSENKKS